MAEANWRDYPNHKVWCCHNQAMPEEYHKRSLCPCLCHIEEFVEGTVSFDDLPEGGTAREVLSGGVPCVVDQRHTFAPFETYCLCGTLERNRGDSFAQVFSIWPTSKAGAGA